MTQQNGAELAVENVLFRFALFCFFVSQRQYERFELMELECIGHSC